MAHGGSWSLQYSRRKDLLGSVVIGHAILLQPIIANASAPSIVG